MAAIGAGEYIVPETTATGGKKIAVAPFRKKILHVLKTPSYRQHAKQYGEILNAYGGVERAVDWIEKEAISNVY